MDTRSMRVPSGRAWAFPRARPQIYAAEPRALAQAAAFYAFARPQAPGRHRAIIALLRTPGGRRLLARRVDFGADIDEGSLDLLLEELGQAGHANLALFRAAWSRRLGVFPLQRDGSITSYVQLAKDPLPEVPIVAGGPFRVPSVLAQASADGWRARSIEPLPRLHTAPRLDRAELRVVTEAIAAQEPTIPAPDPAWIPMHGDLSPWNLRRGGGALWLVDWERWGWGPPHADALHYRLAEHSLTFTQPASLTQRVAGDLGATDLSPAARFWLEHPAYAGALRDPGTAGERADVARRGLVVAALERIAAA